MSSATVQVITALISLAGTIIGGLLTYLMARLKADGERRAQLQQATASKVDDMTHVLARIDRNRADIAAIRHVLEDHGASLAAENRATLERLAAATGPDDLRGVIEQHGAAVINRMKATSALLKAIERGADPSPPDP